jgi:hypothetical protein
LPGGKEERRQRKPFGKLRVYASLRQRRQATKLADR